MHVDVFIKDKGEDGEVGVDGGVTEHQVSIVNGDSHKVEDNGED